MTETRPLPDGVCAQGTLQDAFSKFDTEELRLESAALIARALRILRVIRHIRDGLRARSNYQVHRAIFAKLEAEGKNFSEQLAQWSCRWKEHAPDCAGVAKALQFALKLETKRAFGQELAGIENEANKLAVYARLEDAAGLLLNCYQNIVLLLARAFKLDLKDNQVLGEIANRREESMQLETDLCTIRQAALRLQQNCSGAELAALNKLLGIFRENAMYYLMFRDWGPFEDFIEQLKAAPPHELDAVLHRFVIFLDTLTASVAKRAVLQALDSSEEHRIGSLQAPASS
jgi:hypothetical protein